MSSPSNCFCALRHLVGFDVGGSATDYTVITLFCAQHRTTFGLDEPCPACRAEAEGTPTGSKSDAP